MTNGSSRNSGGSWEHSSKKVLELQESFEQIHALIAEIYAFVAKYEL